MTEIIEYFQVLGEKISLIFERLSEFGGMDLFNTLNLSVAANLELIDDNKTPYFSVIISQNKQEILRKKNPAINFTIKSPKDMWIRVFSGEESLIYNVVSGSARVSNLRVNWMNCIMFSILLSSLISLKILKFN